MVGEAWKCPHCGERILRSALTCPACRRHLRFDAVTTARPGGGDRVEAQVTPAGRTGQRTPQDALAAVRALPRLAHHRRTDSVRRGLRAVLGWSGLSFTLLPPELHLAAHLGSGGDDHAAGLDVADQGPGVLELHPRRCRDLTTDIAGHQDRFGGDLALDESARLDG